MSDFRFNREYRKFRIALAIFIIVSGFFIWYNFLDLRLRPIIKFTNDVNPMELQLTKDSYKPGEMVYGKTSFCKIRPAEGYTQWALSNEIITWYAVKEENIRSLPTGCIPLDKDGFIEFPIKKVPLDAVQGDHLYLGVSVQKTPDGRETRTDLKTRTFTIDFSEHE